MMNNTNMQKARPLPISEKDTISEGRDLPPEKTFMKGKIFVDTNILIYAHDIDERKKHGIAAEIVEQLWETRTGVISIQVLQEFYVNLTRKILHPMPLAEARGLVENYLLWTVETNKPQTILAASEIEERHKISFWDALIITAARQARAEKVLTEDLNHGQTIEGVLIENPFISSR